MISSSRAACAASFSQNKKSFIYLCSLLAHDDDDCFPLFLNSGLLLMVNNVNRDREFYDRQM